MSNHDAPTVKKVKSKISNLIDNATKERNTLYEQGYDEYKDLGLGEEFPQRQAQTINPRLQETLIHVYVMIVTDVEKIFSETILVNERTTMSEIIDLAIKKFNEDKLRIEDKNGKLIGTLAFDPEKTYQIKPAKKKTGRPKDDYPPFLPTATVADTQRMHLAIIYPHSSITIEPINSKKSGGCNESCFIF